MVDTLELMRVEDKKAIAAGQPLKKYTISEILSEFDKAMDQQNKDVVNDVKSDMNWK